MIGAGVIIHVVIPNQDGEGRLGQGGMTIIYRIIGA